MTDDLNSRTANEPLSSGFTTLEDSGLDSVSGGAVTKLSKCPKCHKVAMKIKFKRLECQNCGYVQNFFK